MFFRLLFTGFVLVLVACSEDKQSNPRCGHTINIDVVNGDSSFVGAEEYHYFEAVNQSRFDIETDDPEAHAAQVLFFDPFDTNKEVKSLFEDIGFDYEDDEQLPYLIYLLYGYDLRYSFDGGDPTSFLRIYFYDMDNYTPGDNIHIMDLSEIQENQNQDVDTIIELIKSHAGDDAPSAFVGFSGELSTAASSTFKVVDRLRYAQDGGITIKQYETEPKKGKPQKAMDLDVDVNRNEFNWTMQGDRLCRELEYENWDENIEDEVDHDFF